MNLTLKYKSFKMMFFINIISLGVFFQGIKAQGVAIGNVSFSPVNSALLELRSTSQGVLVPRMTLAQKTAIVSPATGLLIYQTNGNNGFYYFDGSEWLPFTGTGWSLTGNAGTDPSINFLGTTDAQPLRLSTSGQERLRINSGAAEVGIGTTASADNTLDILNTTTSGKGINLTANSLTTGSALSIVSNSLSTGSGIRVTSSATNLSTNGLVNFNLSGSNASNSAPVLKVSNSGALNTGAAFQINNNGVGNSFLINDDGTDSDASPFVVDQSGNTAIGGLTASEKLEVSGNIAINSTGGASNKLHFNTPNNSFMTTFKARNQTSNINYVLPPSQGGSNEVLGNDGAGNLSWISPYNVLGVATNAVNGNGVSQATSTTVYSNVNQMSISLSAGTYIFLFCGDVFVDNGNTIGEFSFLNTDGTTNTESIRKIQPGTNAPGVISLLTLVTVPVSGTARVQFRRNSGTGTITIAGRTFMTIRLS